MRIAGARPGTSLVFRGQSPGSAGLLKMLENRGFEALEPGKKDEDLFDTHQVRKVKD
jgi:hypothetical protein